MLCISAEKEVTRAQLTKAVTPAATETWQPVPHAFLVERILAEADRLGLKLRTERWGLEDGILYHRDGNKVVGKEDVPGARLYGALSFDPASDWPSDMGLSIGIKNANDKSHPLLIPHGAEVFLCENGIVSGEFEIRRKHTSGLDIESLIEEMFEKVITGQARTLEARRRLEALPVTTDQAQLLAVKCATAGAYSSSKILPVLNEFENPSVEGWKEYPRSAWRFYNSANVVVKKAAESAQTTKLSAISQVLFGLIGMTVAA